jgi:hypothetical protein
MTKIVRLPLIALALATSLVPAMALESIDDCRSLSSKWGFSPGGEFPGATGSLESDDKGLALKYDFTGGGNYVAAVRTMPPSEGPLELQIALLASSPVGYHLRVVDATGRTFQSESTLLPADEEAVAAISPETKWAGSWGGKESTTPQFPLQTISIGVERKTGDVAADAGTLFIRKIDYKGAFKKLARFSTEPFEFDALGWKIKGTWGGSLDAPMLYLSASGGAKDALLTCTRPTGDKPVIANFSLKGGAGEKAFDLSKFSPMKLDEKALLVDRVAFDPKFLDGGNVYNRYTVYLDLKTPDGSFRFPVRLSGEKSGEVSFGDPKSSDQIKHLPIGVNSHFLYASLNDSMMGKGYKKLIDLMADAGFKYLRDTPGLETGADGKLHVRPYDIEWITYAKSKGLESILVMLEINDPFADMNDVLVRNVIYAKELKGLVDIFEIGNEINWLAKYPEGTWNGMVSESDKSTARFLEEITKTTNRIADAIAKERPDAVILGLGEGTPLNFRMLALGVTKNLHGVVDHTYTYSLPPEIDVWANNLARDGILVGDREGTFFGWVDSYLAEFAKTGVERKIWMTEFGFSTFSASGENEGKLYAPFSEEAQASYLVRRLLAALYRQDAIAASIQFDIMDSELEHADPESYFGLLRRDFSPKPAYFAMQRLNSLMAEARPSDAKVTVDAAPLHRSAVRSGNVKWDEKSVVKTDKNGVLALPFQNPDEPDQKMVAVWSVQPFSGEFPPRFVSLSINGWQAYDHPLAVGIDVLTGETFDVPVKKENGVLKIGMHVDHNPRLVKFFKAPQTP